MDRSPVLRWRVSLLTVLALLLAPLLLAGQAAARPLAEPATAADQPPHPAATASGWTITGSLATARASHTATLLPNGTVLVAGGYGGFSTGLLASAEVFDPAKGIWSATERLITGRYSHTATRLPNGTVLVAGGFWQAGVARASAEVYDPATGRWSATGDMTSGRHSHTATLLPNGTVLAAGGSSTSGWLASAEVYGPITGDVTWYFAEGATAPGFDEYLTILNATVSDAQLTLTYYLASGGPVQKSLIAPANRRTTVAVHDDARGVGRDKEVSAKVTSTNGVPIVVERPIYFRYGSSITGGHNVLGRHQPPPELVLRRGPHRPGLRPVPDDHEP